jgi:DNA-directed RNA polymerase sigma subunit (sigma70/sigma32)
MDLCDATARDPAEAVCALHEAEERQRWLEEAIHRLLPPRQRAVMEALLDRGDRWHPATLVEVARKLRLHPERVRQLREDALARLRAAWQAHCQHKTRPQERPEKGVITHDTAIFLG